jgi:CRP-like cAMP-binding protein
MLRIITMLSGYVRRKDDAFAEVAFLDITGRVAQKLLDLAESNGQLTADGVRIGMRLSQRALAGMVGASRENVNRALSRFGAGGAIRQDGGVITILDPAALRRRV